MCTVSFIPHPNSGFVLTSNRDEAPGRDTFPPSIHEFENTRMLFPMDKHAGGTWIGLSDKKRLVCVLNGGFNFHERKAEYRLSRGIVARDLMAAQDIDTAILEYHLNDIEPFTMIIVQWDKELKLLELVWDGEQKHFSALPLEPRIWSSSTLYDAQMKASREAWFDRFLQRNDLSSKSLLDFHMTAGGNNDEFGVIMDRGFVKTTSITQITNPEGVANMRYHDLDRDEVTEVRFNTTESIHE